MALTVNSRFLAVSRSNQNIDTGYQVRVLDYKNMTSLVAIISEFSSVNFSMELNATGSGSVTLDADSPFWRQYLGGGQRATALKDREYVFEIWENNQPRFSFLGQTVSETIINDGETREVTIAGPGIAQTLTWACIMRPGWPRKAPILRYKNVNVSETGVGTTIKKIPIYRDVSYNDTLPAFLWRFPMTWTTMRMWYTVLKAAQRRGLISFVKPMFNATRDSANHKWEWVGTVDMIAEAQGYQPKEPNESLLDFLNECTGQDSSTWFGQRLEWIMYPGFKLDVRERIGVDRSRTVRFYAGQIVSNERVRDREKIFNRITAVDVEGGESIRISTTSVANWNLREQRNETQKQVTDKSMRDALANKFLQQQKDERSEWTIQLPPDDPGRRKPFRDFRVGDQIGLCVDDDSMEVSKFRVLAISVSLTADQTEPDIQLTLQSVIDTKMIELERSITRLINQPKNFRLEDILDLKIPDSPDEEYTLVYNPKTKKWEVKKVSDLNGGSNPGGGGTDPGSGGNGDGSYGPRVFVQSIDPATQTGTTISAGDFWLETY